MKGSNKPSFFVPLAAVAILALAASPAARATVTLKLSDNDATPTSVTVAAGSTFTVTASLLSTSEQLTGVDYYLQVSGAASGKFRITDRNIGSTAFNDPLKNDTGDNGLNPGVEDASFNRLSPRNALDLGASIANVNSPLAAGTYNLATYTIGIDPTTPAGTYTLSTTSDAGTGYVVGAPSFDEFPFAAHGTFSVTVQANNPGTPVPEPGALSLLAIAALALRRR